MSPVEQRHRMIRLVRLSVLAAVATIALKTAAWAVTGSVGLLSDAAESLVNLVAALVALFVVHWSTQPPDEEHAYGHEKAGYLSAGLEGGLILLAAGTIGYGAVDRLIDPQELDSVGIGLAVSAVATVINLVMARALIRTGRAYASITLEADGRHLLTDVWTSVGVAVGIVLVVVTGWERLDPIIALLVAANIVVTGVGLIRRSTSGLMDKALEPDELARVTAVLDRHRCAEVEFHALRTRRSGPRAFVSVHVLVPGSWSVQHGHDVIEGIEADLRAAIPHGLTTIFTHLEPIEDPVSFADRDLDRRDGGPADAAAAPDARRG
nr:cation diffusion facilitator family transporter [Paraconexibacter algicola]